MDSIRPNIYLYDEARTFLRDFFAYKRREKGHFSISAWARVMGFVSPSSLTNFLNGRRKIRLDHAPMIFQGLDLDQNEKSFFRILVGLENGPSKAERERLLREMEELRLFSGHFHCDVETFRLISEWYYMTVLSMVDLHDFEPSASWISQRLNGKISENEAQKAMDNLLQLRLLGWEGEKLVRTHHRLVTGGKGKNQAIRQHHSQVLSLAKSAIWEQPTEERFLESCALTIDVSKLEEAQKLISEFRNNMSRLTHKKGGEETYQLSVQFFKLTHVRESQKTSDMRTNPDVI